MEFTTEHLLKGYPPPIQELVARIRQLVLEVAPDASEKANRGWKSISFRDSQVGYFCGIFPFEDRVDLAFEFGALLPDPEGLLDGETKQVRYVRLKDSDELRAEPIKQLVLAALALPTDHSLRHGLLQSKTTVQTSRSIHSNDKMEE